MKNYTLYGYVFSLGSFQENLETEPQYYQENKKIASQDEKKTIPDFAMIAPNDHKPKPQKQEKKTHGFFKIFIYLALFGALCGAVWFFFLRKTNSEVEKNELVGGKQNQNEGSKAARSEAQKAKEDDEY